MYFLYVDESGKSGLRDPAQPYYVLGGLAVDEADWLEMEQELSQRIDKLVPPPRSVRWELHMTDMVNGKGWFKGMPRATRDALADAVLKVVDSYEPTLIFIVIDKKALIAQYSRPAPPEELAYCFMIERFNRVLERVDQVGVIVSDEQKGEEDAIREAHARYRTTGTGYVVADQVIETPFFAPSHWSLLLQAVDVVTWIVNRTFRDEANGKPERAEWARIEARLDCYPQHRGKGLKVFP